MSTPTDRITRAATRATLVLALLGVHAVATAATQVTISFTSQEAAIIRDYYRVQAPSDHYDQASTGKPARNGGGKGQQGKSKPLPPGIAMNLERGKALPPGIAKQRLPDSLLRQLPPLPRGYERVIVDGKVLLVEVATQVIRDVLSDVLFD
jgi:Ni/Co efflux regulator RcnB